MSASRGDRIRQARQLRRMSQQDLAAATGIGARTIRRIETGENESSRSITILETYLELTPPTTTPSAEQPTIERALHDATVLELLAELASRYATLEAATRRGDQPVGPPERYTWYKRDAPTARRAEDDPGPDEQGGSGSGEL